MSEWQVVPLGEVCELKRGYDLPNGSRRDGRIPVVSSSGPTGWHDEAKVSAPGVVTGRYGTLGQVFYIAEDFWPLNTALYVRDFKGNEPRFVAALLRSMDLAQYDGAAAVPGLNRNHLHAVPVRVPAVRTTQGAIADVIQAFDDLIRNNRRRVEVLEEVARAIYQEWFVKFRYPGHSDVPMVDSVLGPIPEDWGAGKIGELCSRVQAGATPRRSTPEYWDEPSVDWYKTGDLTDGVLLSSSERLSVAGLEAGRTFEPETILMAMYGATIGRLGFLTSRASANQAALGLVADPAVCTTEYLWFALESLRGHLVQIAQGAAQQNVSKEKIIVCDVLMPPGEVMEDFTLRVAPGWRLSHELARQASVLESLRDLLLPKLVTGQIDVSTLDLDALLVEQVA
jgi:type I restriction enzyme S subunit